MIVASHVERMLKGAVEQTVKSKGRLDDPGIIEGSMLAACLVRDKQQGLKGSDEEEDGGGERRGGMKEEGMSW